MKTSTVSEKGWVVIPREIRRRFGLKKGSKVVVVEYGGVIAVLPVSKEPVPEATGMLEDDASLVEALVKSRRRDAARGR